MADDITMRLRQNHVDTSVIHLTTGYSKHSIKQGFSHQMKINPTNNSKLITACFLNLFWKYYDHEPVRSIGLTCGKITTKSGLQLDLFESAEKTLKQAKLDYTIDRIRERYGFKSLMHANSLLEGATGIERAKMVGGHRG